MIAIGEFAFIVLSSQVPLTCLSRATKRSSFLFLLKAKCLLTCTRPGMQLLPLQLAAVEVLMTGSNALNSICPGIITGFHAEGARRSMPDSIS
jgi:hypothetical protein